MGLLTVHFFFLVAGDSSCTKFSRELRSFLSASPSIPGKKKKEKVIAHFCCGKSFFVAP